MGGGRADRGERRSPPDAASPRGPVPRRRTRTTGNHRRNRPSRSGRHTVRIRSSNTARQRRLQPDRSVARSAGRTSLAASPSLVVVDRRLSRIWGLRRRSVGGSGRVPDDPARNAPSCCSSGEHIAQIQPHRVAPSAAGACAQRPTGGR